MKKLFHLFIVLASSLLLAQAPTDYYSGTENLTGYSLKSKLSDIISNGHQDQGYDNLYSGYTATDSDYFYENDGSVLDMYSENPNGTDPYNYSHNNKTCGNYKAESDCYNREHIIPQSLFGSRTPMRNDIHFVVPSDGYVNGKRSNFPFGEVNAASYVSKNGSKLGYNTSPGFQGTVFEPIDEFKGDIARMIFYFVTRYENLLPSFNQGDIFNGTREQGLQKWQLDLLLKWHLKDPVSPREIARNNAAYNYQGNRNPYIDNPSWVSAIWGESADQTPPSVPSNVSISNITANSATVQWTASTDDVAVAGYRVYIDGQLHTSSSTTTATLNGLQANTTYTVTVDAYDAMGNASAQSQSISFTTNTLVAPIPSIPCATEDFEAIPASNSNYSTRTWSNNGILWTATDARTDQSLNGRAILIRNGKLEASATANGIGSLKITTKRVFSGGSGTFTLKVNGNSVGTIPYGDNETTTTIENINISGNVIISIENNSSSSNRVLFDNLSWTCYQDLSTEAFDSPKAIRIKENPIRNGEIHLQGNDLNRITKADIYTSSGQLVKSIPHPFSNGNTITVYQLPKGIYLLYLDGQTLKFLVK
ncbi:endonuclease [Bergeyella sp. RCAD1439]|uniref:endonuclease n=1 Tax=Bergeyella anatis TaxID=3113737 RepID=UPI002E18C24A|nr:endonuclease [Bergeyella sp. RCAD1439]